MHPYKAEILRQTFALAPNARVRGGGQWIVHAEPCSCRRSNEVRLSTRHLSRSWLSTVDACLEATITAPHCPLLTISRELKTCACSNTCEREPQNSTYLCGSRELAASPRVPVGGLQLPRLTASGRAALQLSGHLGNDCNFENAFRHKHACEHVFGRCELFVHTWNETEPRTIHWSGQPRRPSRPLDVACIERVRASLTPTALLIEQQPPSPPTPSPPPVTSSSRLRRDALRDPARQHGWDMNALAMRHSADLRQQFSRREHAQFDVAVRLRPEAVPWGRLTDETMHQLWQCIALIARGPESLWKSDARRRLHPCSPTGDLALAAQDNCFFGLPEAMDNAFSRLGTPGSPQRRAVRREAGRWRIKPWHYERLLAVAAQLSGHRTGTACHIDTLRYQFA